MSTSAVSRNAVSTLVLTLIPSSPAPALRLPPTKSMLSAISSALRVAVPLSSSDAVNDATPALPAGSCFAPLRSRRFTETTGCSWFSTMMTRAPFFSVRSWNAGNSTGRRGAGAGGGSFCCAAAGAAPRPSASARNAALPTMLLILVIVPSSLGAGSGPGCRLVRPGRALRRDHRHDRAVRLGEILARDRADVLDGHGDVAFVVAVDLCRVAVEAAVVVQRLRLRERRLVPHDLAGPGLVLRLLELALRHALVLQLLDLLRDQRLQPLRLHALVRQREEQERARPHAAVQPRPDLERGPLLLDQPPVQPARLALAEDGRQQLQRVRVRVVVRRNVEAHRDQRQRRQLVLDGDAALAIRARRRRRRRQ